MVPLSSQPSVRPAKRSLWSTRVSLLLVAALVGGLAGHYASTSNTGPGGVTIDAVTNKPGAAYLPGGMSIPKLINKALPSIVSIDVKGQGQEDQGTGMVITKNGLVITNNHVIAAAVNGGTITVTRTGSTKALPATLIGTNPIDDVALIRINNISGLTPVTFGNSNDLVVGDAVVAIGNALGTGRGHAHRHVGHRVGARSHRHRRFEQFERNTQQHDPNRRRDQSRQLRWSVARFER